MEDYHPSNLTSGRPDRSPPIDPLSTTQRLGGLRVLPRVSRFERPPSSSAEHARGATFALVTALRAVTALLTPR
jgi:hypothetical protein